MEIQFRQLQRRIYYAFYGHISGYTVSNPSYGIVMFTNNMGRADKNVVITIK